MADGGYGYVDGGDMSVTSRFRGGYTVLRENYGMVAEAEEGYGYVDGGYMADA